MCANQRFRRIPDVPKQMLLSWRQEITADDLVGIRVAARDLVGRHEYTRSDLDDIVQDLALHVLERLLGEYDPGRGACGIRIRGTQYASHVTYATRHARAAN